MRDLVPNEYSVWKESVHDAFEIMEELSEGATPPAPKPEVAVLPEGAVAPEIPAEPVVEDPRLKLLQNFKDLKDAVDNMNKTYFGLDQNPSV
jgi:hypothetical protein